MSTGEIVHRGLRYELMPVSMLISTAVPYCLLLEGVELLIFTTDKAYGRAAVSQGGVGKRWKNHGVFLRYSYSSGLILPLLASDARPRVRRPSGLDSSVLGPVCNSVVPDLFRTSARQEKRRNVPPRSI